MQSKKEEIVAITIESELKRSYLNYAMSVIVSRALPDVRDGLKPVHRRVLFAMSNLNNYWNRAYKKSARVVGDVIGKYHPHGDVPVYDAIVRMVQPFSMRYPLIDGQGNFGSIDGDSPAAMRYTEIRMHHLTDFILRDLEKETVDFSPNYDNSEEIPNVLPASFPNLLVNGSSGIAVGMATNIPPHDLTEIIDGSIALLQNPDLSVQDLIKYIPGPDFPTGGIIEGREGIYNAYTTGKGRINIRAKTKIEESKNRSAIVIEELPFQVNKAKLLENIAFLVKSRKIEGITAIRDESDMQGMRAVIELKHKSIAEVVLNNLYANTRLRIAFSCNLVALAPNSKPYLFNLKEILTAFIEHRKEVIIRKTLYELKEAEKRAHILEGLSVALDNLDEVIELIKNAASPSEAKKLLMTTAYRNTKLQELIFSLQNSQFHENRALEKNEFYFSKSQAQAILDLKLQRLTALEKEKIFNEYLEIATLIKNLKDILSNEERLKEIITNELEEIKRSFGDKRRTEIDHHYSNFEIEDLIEKEEMAVIFSMQGYIKTQPLKNYQVQHRGGKGKISASLKEDDVIENIMIANSHDIILCFSNFGKVYGLKVYQIPQTSRFAKSKPIINFLPLGEDEKINTFLTFQKFKDKKFIFFSTANGRIKKTMVEEFNKIRFHGIRALKLQENDTLIGVELTSGSQEIMLFTNYGKALRFKEERLRAMQRSARGIRGMRLLKPYSIISMLIVDDNKKILIAASNGYGKCIKFKEFRTQKGAGQGITAIKMNYSESRVIGAMSISDEDEVMLIGNRGTVIRILAHEISVYGRSAKGVKLINLNQDEELISISRIEKDSV